MDKNVISLYEARSRKKPAAILDSLVHPGPGKLTFGALRLMATLLKGKKIHPREKRDFRKVGNGSGSSFCLCVKRA